MAKSLQFAKLDFVTIKPYLTFKNLIIFLSIALTTSLIAGNGSAAIGIFAMYGFLFTTYPFAVCELNGMDKLYATLPISRREVVLGRYIFALCVIVTACFMGCALCIAVFMALSKPFAFIVTAASTALVFFMFCFLLSIALPVYFRLGYTKAKLVVYAPFLSVPLVTVAVSTSWGQAVLMPMIAGLFEWIAINLILAVALSMAVLLFALFLSYSISQKFYNNRDF